MTVLSGHLRCFSKFPYSGLVSFLICLTAPSVQTRLLLTIYDYQLQIMLLHLRRSNIVLGCEVSFILICSIFLPSCFCFAYLCYLPLHKQTNIPPDLVLKSRFCIRNSSTMKNSHVNVFLKIQVRNQSSETVATQIIKAN